jgi:hypothetical protein
MIYVVTWFIVNFVTTPCPSYTTKDEFNRVTVHEGYGYCSKKQYSELQIKEFTIKDSALAFYRRAVWHQVRTINLHVGGLDSIKIDSTGNIKKYKEVRGIDD